MPLLIPTSTLEKFSTFGDLLRYLRRRVGLTQMELADTVGYSDAQISRLEQNLRPPDLSIIESHFVPALGLEDEPNTVARLLDLAADVRREDAPALGLCPYKGLNYFDESDADLFVGREALTNKLVDRALALASDAWRFLAIVGASGSGKSSLVRAGLVPALRWNKQSMDWMIHILTPTARPLESLAASLNHDTAMAANPEMLANNLAGDVRSLQRYASNGMEGRTGSRQLLVIDQFEELFALCHNEDERGAFIGNLLAAASEPDGPIFVVITLRADFYAHCAAYEQLREALARSQEYIGAMSDGELRRVIEEPARRGRWEFEPGLVDLLLHDVGREPGALPLLSHALLETWQRRRGHTMTLSGYTSSGGVRGAIAETAEAVFADQFTHEQQGIARRIFLRLTELGDESGAADTRRRATFNELILKPEEASVTLAVVKALADARLIITSEDSAEVAHEALIREWPTLHGWLEENRESLRLHRQLTEAAHDWSKMDQDSDLLYRGTRLAQAREWAPGHEDEMNALEYEFLTASVKASERQAAEREAQQRRELEAARQLADAERARAEEQANSANRLRTRNRVVSSVGIIAVILAILAGVLASRNSSLAANYAESASMASSQRAVAEAEADGRATQQAIAEGEALARATQQAFAESEAQARATAEANALKERDLAQAQRLAAEANSLMLSNGSPELIALLGVSSLNMLYTPAGDAVLTNTSLADISPRKFPGHSNGIIVGGAVFSPDGRYLATASEDKTARLWDMASGETVHVFAGHTYELLGIAFSPDGKTLATTSLDGTARLWDVNTGQEVRAWVGPADVTFFGVAFSPDGKTILTASDFSEDNTARLWEAATGQVIREFVGHTAGVISVDISPDGRLIGTASRDGTARLWEATTGRQLHLLQGHENEVAVIRFSPDGNLVATSGDDRIIRLWETASGQLVRELEGHKDWVQSLAFSPNGKFLISGSNDRTARLWDVASGQPVHVFAHPNGVEAVSFSPDGKTIATGGPDMLIRLWRLQANVGNAKLAGHTGVVWGASFSPDGKFIVTASADHTARLWEAVSGLELRKFTGHTDVVRDAIFSPDGKSVLTTSRDGTARLWDAASGEELRRFEGHTDLVNRAIFSPDEKYIITTSFDGTARVWDAQTGQTVLIYTRQGPGHVNRIAFSPDGQTVATSGDDGTARLWDPWSGEEIKVFKGHSALVAGVAFSPDGTYLVTSSWDGTVRLWEVATGKELRRFAGHSGYAFGAAFSPDGQYVLSSGADGTARLWDVQTGQELRRFTGHTNWVTNVTFSPDGKYILTASDDNTARLWLTDLQDTLRTVCSLLTRDLTPEERARYNLSDQGPTCPAQ